MQTRSPDSMSVATVWHGRVSSSNVLVDPTAGMKMAFRRLPVSSPGRVSVTSSAESVVRLVAICLAKCSISSPDSPAA
jgi:hypothetical protein